MASKRGSNKKGSNKQANTGGITITAEEAKLLEQAKKAQKDFELDLNEFKAILEEDYLQTYEEKKQNIDAEMEDEKDKIRADFEEKLQKEHIDEIEETGILKKKNEELSKAMDKLEKKVEQIKKDQEETEKSAHEEAERIIADAQRQAEITINDAKKQAEDECKIILESINKLQDENKIRAEELEDKEMELDAREAVLAGRERRVQKQAEVYEASNPDAVASLERKLQMRAEQLEQVQTEYESAQRELNRIKIQQIKSEGISPEELQKTNEMLSARVEELTNKCNRFTEYELDEMQRALNQEENYLIQIKNLSNELSSRKVELERLNNSILEYEQLRSQMDLLRTLNEHLRSELDNTKRMLESNVGEICPALTSIDIEEASENGKRYVLYQERLDNRNENIKTLKDLVEHIKSYAASQQKPLFYSDKDLRAFIAGMAASPMAILQGMSGTGKTSLPKVFCEAVMGELSIVPVESSWRDRNELLGYYNDFSKKFTAKEFTCNLYRAGCKNYEDTICFIVLDEMNLSRVEYYFADFLSVLEDKKENWKIRLVDTDMRQLPTEITEDVIKELENDKKQKSKELLEIVNKLYPDCKISEDETIVTASDRLRLIAYLSERQARIDTPVNCRVGGPQNLIGGNTIQIPKNVWFVGTANRDESTFEITDKVYDRAQVLNFNNRAKGNKIDSNIPKVYLTYGELNTLFLKARGNKKINFKAEDYEVLQEIEHILKKYFRISYGNRIQDQMDTFVPVYVSAGMDAKTTPEEITVLINEAIDYQLTNKVLRKLEYEDINKDAAEKLRKLFEGNKLTLATEFLNWKTRGEGV